MTTATKAWRGAITDEELRELREVKDWRGWLALFQDYATIAGSMALVAYVPDVWTVVLALLLIGSRQLGFAILAHESAHRIWFKNRRLNDWAGDWLAGYPIYLSAEMFRPHHLDHHGKTWGRNDPDLVLCSGFPVSKMSMARKVLRDLTGITGLKQLIGTTILLIQTIRGREVGASSLPMRLERGRAIRLLVGTVATNAVLFGLLWAFGQPMLYLLWVGAWLTTNKLFVRVRSMAEHARVPNPNPGDPFGNTRTTLLSWWERLLFAPHNVGYHLEHHLVVTVPQYNLPRSHRLLRDRGVLDEACIAKGYPDVLRQMVA